MSTEQKKISAFIEDSLKNHNNSGQTLDGTVDNNEDLDSEGYDNIDPLDVPTEVPIEDEQIVVAGLEDPNQLSDGYQLMLDMKNRLEKLQVKTKGKDLTDKSTDNKNNVITDLKSLKEPELTHDDLPDLVTIDPLSTIKQGKLSDNDYITYQDAAGERMRELPNRLHDLYHVQKVLTKSEHQHFSTQLQLLVMQSMKGSAVTKSQLKTLEEEIETVTAKRKVISPNLYNKPQDISQILTSTKEGYFLPRTPSNVLNVREAMNKEQDDLQLALLLSMTDKDKLELAQSQPMKLSDHSDKSDVKDNSDLKDKSEKTISKELKIAQNSKDQENSLLNTVEKTKKFLQLIKKNPGYQSIHIEPGNNKDKLLEQLALKEISEYFKNPAAYSRNEKPMNKIMHAVIPDFEQQEILANLQKFGGGDLERQKSLEKEFQPNKKGK